MASSRSHPVVCPAVVVILILGLCTVTWAVEFAGGTGEPNDPYRIATAEQLIAISSDASLYDKHFLLTADIDLDPNLPGGTVFQGAVIQWSTPRTRAGQDSRLHGSFDGGGHVIRNCVLFKTRYSTYTYAAFIGMIAEEGVVRDLRLEDVVIVESQDSATSSYFCGTLAGVNYGTVVGCSATGIVTGFQSGGLIGRNAGVVAGCQADCDVLGSTVGGLIGLNEATGRVILCKSGGLVYGDQQAGGLVARNEGTIQYCATDSFVSAPLAGGLACYNTGRIRESCSTAMTIAGQSGAGIARDNSGTIVNCHATGSSLSIYMDGLVVLNTGAILSSYSTTPSQARPSPATRVRAFEVTAAASAGKTVRYVYYLDSSKAPGQTSSSYEGYGVPLSPEEMKQPSSFVGFDFYGDANDGPMGHWFMPPDGYPVLTWQTQITGFVGVPDVSGLSPEQAGLVLETMGLEPNGVTYDYAKPQFVSDAGTVRQVDKGQVIVARPVGYLPVGSRVGIVVSLGRYGFGWNAGDGSGANPYQIATAGQLDSLYDGTIPANQHFILTADIDLSGYVYPGALIRQLFGDFDGNGHTIRGLQVIIPASSGMGCALFARVESGGSVHDLTVDQATLCAAGYSTIALLAGENDGQVVRCTASGYILGGSAGIGGLVGHNNVHGQLMDCRFSGRIQPASDSTDVGGLVGNNMGAVVRCCARDVDVSGGQCVGGLVGQNMYASAVVEACYATGSVRGSVNVGGLLGRNGRYLPVRSVLAQSQITVSADPAADSTVRECYAACSVTGQQNVGGLIGLAIVEAVQESCFFLAPQDGGGPDNGLGTALTASQMKQQASFTGWDFIDTWMICEGKDYPRLRWEGAVCEE
ncbi:MAG: PASTA domain-containing protein [Sedimentisphaerales bacterium]|nr:PASTA domain-containing protein [Sedimentisphaerales bacterium]